MDNWDKVNRNLEATIGLIVIIIVLKVIEIIVRIYGSN